MKIFRNFIIVIALVFFGFQKTSAADDSFTGLRTTLPFTIDGIASETVWDSAAWYPMSWVWLPYNDVVDSLDFTGRFKIAWTTERLYLLVEVVDDSLFDGHPSPLDNYWNDDCVEVFLDENKSGGNHNDASNAFNAFAMHVSTIFDVVDNGKSGTALFNNLITASRTKNDSLYLWELEIKVYPSTYNPSSPGDPMILTPNKVMGFSLAYCDDDGSGSRENFIGSKYLPQSQSNDSYINASIFGSLTLYDPDYIPVDAVINNEQLPIVFYPNPAKDIIYYTSSGKADSKYTIRIVNLTGQIILEKQLENNSGSGSISLGNINNGVYSLELINCERSYSQQVVIF